MEMKLSEVARIMYDLQEYCNDRGCYNCTINNLCALYGKKLSSPNTWGITKVDIERLEREGK